MVLSSIARSQETINIQEIRKLEGQKIALIKEYRRFTGMGLKDSKDAIERGQSRGGIEGVIQEFMNYSSPRKVDIDMFKNLVCTAIDHMDDMWYPTYCKGLAALVANLEELGGDDYLIAHFNEFMKGLVGDG